MINVTDIINMMHCWRQITKNDMRMSKKNYPTTTEKIILDLLSFWFLIKFYDRFFLLSSAAVLIYAAFFSIFIDKYMIDSMVWNRVFHEFIRIAFLDFIFDFLFSYLPTNVLHIIYWLIGPKYLIVSTRKNWFRCNLLSGFFFLFYYCVLMKLKLFIMFNFFLLLLFLLVYQFVCSVLEILVLDGLIVDFSCSIHVSCEVIFLTCEIDQCVSCFFFINNSFYFFE